MRARYGLSDTFRSVKSDVPPVSAVEELIDSVLDYRASVDQKNPDVPTDIEFDADEGPDEGELSVLGSGTDVQAPTQPSHEWEFRL